MSHVVLETRRNGSEVLSYPMPLYSVLYNEIMQHSILSWEVTSLSEVILWSVEWRAVVSFITFSIVGLHNVLSHGVMSDRNRCCAVK